MRRSFIVFVSLVVTASLMLAACTPAATPTPTQPAAQAQATATTAMEVEPTATTAVEAEPTATTAATTAPETQEGMLPEVDPMEVTGNVVTAGSSTVYPLSEAIVELFKSEGYAGEVTIDSIGTGGGFERFCKSGETDISNASRKIKESEVENCKAINRVPVEFRVGTDAMALVVNPANDFVTDLTAAEVALIFSDKTEKWSDVNPEWPDELIKRYAPGTDSGTYDFFIEAIMQPAYEKDVKLAQAAFQAAANLQSSEDDNVLVQGIAGDQYAIGFFGFAYYQENEGKVKIVSINGITPSLETAEDHTYILSRPLFIYSDAAIIQSKPQVAAFINFYLARVDDVIGDVGYFPASDANLEQARQNLIDALK